MIKYIKKDICTVVGKSLILQGVNCQNAMGSGLAKVIYELWPWVKIQFHQQGKGTLGNIHCIQVEPNQHVVNCYTQEFYGRDKYTRYGSPQAILECLLKVSKLAITLHVTEIYLPRIGCGLANLNWETDVVPSLEYVQAKYPSLNFTVCDLPS